MGIVDARLEDFLEGDGGAERVLGPEGEDAGVVLGYVLR